MSKKQENKNWFGIVLRGGEVYLCFDMKKNETKQTKAIKGFLAHIDEKGTSDDVFEDEVSIRIPNMRIPRTLEHLESDIQFLMFLKKNKLCGETLTAKMPKAKALEKIEKESKKNKGTKLKLAQ